MAKKVKGGTKGGTKIDAPSERRKTKPNVIIQGDVVRVWSEVGVTIAVTDDPMQFVRFTFGHERISKNSTAKEIARTANLVDEFNEREVEKRLRKYKRLVRRESAVQDSDDTPGNRAKRRLGR